MSSIRLLLEAAETHGYHKITCHHWNADHLELQGRNGNVHVEQGPRGRVTTLLDSRKPVLEYEKSTLEAARLFMYCGSPEDLEYRDLLRRQDAWELSKWTRGR